PLRFLTDSSIVRADSSIVKVGEVGVAVGALGGQLAGFGNPYAAGSLVIAGPIAYEIRDRIKAGIPALLVALGTIPGVGEIIPPSIHSTGKPVPGPLPGPCIFANLIGGVAAYQMMLPKPLPIDAYRAELVKKMTDEVAKKQAQKDSEEFIKEVNKLS